MTIKRIKDYTGLISSGIMKTADKKHYWNLYLWQDNDCLRRNTVNMDKEVLGCHCSVPVLIDPESEDPCPKPKIGELHFIQGVWDVNYVAHELSHALFQRLKFLCPNPNTVLKEDNMEIEEFYCYEFGDWMQGICNWLYNNDPPNEMIDILGREI